MKLANTATSACHQVYLAAINKLPNHCTFSDARQILWRQVAVRATEKRALHTGALIELGVHSRGPFDPRRPAEALHYTKKPRLDEDVTASSSDIQAGDRVGPRRY